MEYTQTQWTIKKLVDVYNKGNLDLSPPYQRNFIWSIKDQEELIESINEYHPLPSIFLYERTVGSYEMVDGQQRSRTILNYVKKKGKDFWKESEGRPFFSYKIPVTIISKINSGMTIEKLYAKLNKTGKHLNNPELKKGDYFETNFLKLNERLAATNSFQRLQLFGNASINRMNDVDLVSELTTYLISGVTDKKESVERVYEKDIDDDKVKEVESKFLFIIDVLVELNNEYPINRTRYKQRNDFYTLFHFIDANSKLSVEDFKYFYEELIILSPFISPADDKCPPLKEYARNCVTQSNSKNARNKRFELLNSILMGQNAKPSDEQKEIKLFFDLGKGCFLKKNSYNTFRIDVLSKLDDIDA